MLTGRSLLAYINQSGGFFAGANGFGSSLQNNQLGIAQIPTNACSIEILTTLYGVPSGTLAHFDASFPSSTTYDRCLFIGIGGTPKFQIFAGSNKIAVSAVSLSGSGSTQQTVHLVGTTDGTTVNIYVNGVLQGSTGGGTAFGGNAYFIINGGNNPDNVGSNAGATLLSNYANVAWTAQEVMARYAEPFNFYNFGLDSLLSYLVAFSTVLSYRQPAQRRHRLIR